MITVEMVDKVMARTNCSYEEAKALLEEAEGSVEKAILLFNLKNKQRLNDMNSVDSVVAFLKSLIQKGMINRITVEKDGETILNVPLNVGIVAAVFATLPSLVAVATAFVTGCKVTIEKNDGSSVDLKDYAMEKGKDISETIKEKVSDYKDKKEEVEETESGEEE